MIFVAFIVGIVLGALIGALFVYYAEIEVLRRFQRRIDDLESSYNDIIAGLIHGTDTADEWCE